MTTNTAQAVTPVYRADVPLMTVEEFLDYLGYENQNGKWVQVDGQGSILIGVDLQKGFCLGGNLATNWGHEAMAPANEAASFRNLWTLRALTRDYHPKGAHCSFSWAYKAYVNNTAPVLMTVADLKAMGSTDVDVLTPEAIAAGMNVREILEGLENAEDPAVRGALMVWPGGHCEQGTEDSDFHPDLDQTLWDFVQTKGWRFPNWEEYGVFYTLMGYKRSSNGFQENIQKMLTTRTRYLPNKQVVTKIKRAVLLGLVSEYCVITSALQAQALQYDVVIAIDGVRPFDPDGEAKAFGRQLAEGHRFVSNEVMREANTILAAQYGVVV